MAAGQKKKRRSGGGQPPAPKKGRTLDDYVAFLVASSQERNWSSVDLDVSAWAILIFFHSMITLSSALTHDSKFSF